MERKDRRIVVKVGTSTLTTETGMDNLRAFDAVGQCSLMFLYDKFFGEYGKTAAQILLNAEDMEHELKKDNLAGTFDTLLEMGVIPIVNENDSVSCAEIESSERLFGDNDMLSAIVAVLCRASKLIILSDVDGLYARDPRLHPGTEPIPLVERIDEGLYALAGGAGSRRGTGGMRTKLQAAELATSQGIDTLIANGRRVSELHDMARFMNIGTRFAAVRRP
ncbi:MAG: glutamate 5-kinase [Desulfovibrionaceae bacterium]|nr:glutamate 5-kinase [Desulfovibrionaceae bacterium]